MKTKTAYLRIALGLLFAVVLATCAPARGSGGSATMGPAQGTPRVRAWVLLTTADAFQATEAIVPLFEEGGSEWVIIRADVIEGGKDVMVAVDAASQASLQEAMGRLVEATGGKLQEAWQVIAHNPSVPHAAQSFITPEELDGLYAEEFDPPGRHKPKSPGANPWG